MWLVAGGLHHNGRGLEQAGCKRLLFRAIIQRRGHYQGFDYNRVDYSLRVLSSSFIFSSFNILFINYQHCSDMLTIVCILPHTHTECTHTHTVRSVH